MPKLVIDNNLLAAEFFEDAVLLGVQCPLEPHLFVWLVNRHLGYAFKYQRESEIHLTSQRRTYAYPIYQCNEQHLELIHLLYVNGNDGKHLLPELKHVDFLWLLKGTLPNIQFVATLMQAIKQMDQVQLVMELTNEKIKNKAHLVL